MKYPDELKKHSIEGKVFVQFFIDENGSITEAKIIKGLGYGADEEALRVINLMPKWKPGVQRGKAVKVQMVLPIIFKLS